MKLSIPRWITIGVIVILAFVLLRRFYTSEGFQKSSKVTMRQDPDPNAPDRPDSFILYPVYNFSTNQVDISYVIEMNHTPKIIPDGYKVYLNPDSNNSGQPSSDSILLDTFSYQDTPIKITRSYSPSIFNNKTACLDSLFVIWSYKGNLFSNGSLAMSTGIDYTQHFSNLPATQASFDGIIDGLANLKIISSSFSQYPCLVYTGGSYSLGYAVRTSLDGTNWNPIYTGGADPSDLTANVLFVPPSSTQTSYVQIAAFDNGQQTVISPWSSTITIPSA